jgi:hypothetical protein
MVQLIKKNRKTIKYKNRRFRNFLWRVKKLNFQQKNFLLIWIVVFRGFWHGELESEGIFWFWPRGVFYFCRYVFSLGTIQSWNLKRFMKFSSWKVSLAVNGTIETSGNRENEQLILYPRRKPKRVYQKSLKNPKGPPLYFWPKSYTPSLYLLPHEKTLALFWPIEFTPKS